MNFLEQEFPSDIIEAIKEGPDDVAMEMLLSGEGLIEGLLGFRDSSGNTPLYLASVNGHAGVVRLLLGAGANVSDVNEFGNTALIAAVHGGYVNVKRRPNVHRLNRESIAVNDGNVEVVEMLLAHGADVNFQNSFGNTALIAAIEENHVKVVGMLLEHGADVNLQNSRGYTALIVAAESQPSIENSEVVWMLLVAETDLNLQNLDGTTALTAAVDNVKVDVVRNILSGCRSYVQGNIAVVNHQDANNNTPLLIAAERGNAEIVEMLLVGGADANFQNIWYWTPLLIAVEGGHAKIVEMLLEHGADVNLQNQDGTTALIMAVQGSRDERQDPRLGVADPAQVAVIRHIIDPKYGITLENLNLTQVNGLTALMIAAKEGNAEVLWMLLVSGADVDFQNYLGNTALMEASESTNPATMLTVENLMKAGADVAMVNGTGDSAMHKLARNTSDDVNAGILVQKMMQANGDRHAVNNEGENVFDVATGKNNVNVITALLGGPVRGPPAAGGNKKFKPKKKKKKKTAKKNKRSTKRR